MNKQITITINYKEFKIIKERLDSLKDDCFTYISNNLSEKDLKNSIKYTYEYIYIEFLDIPIKKDIFNDQQLEFFTSIKDAILYNIKMEYIESITDTLNDIVQLINNIILEIYLNYEIEIKLWHKDKLKSLTNNPDFLSYYEDWFKWV